MAHRPKLKRDVKEPRGKPYKGLHYDDLGEAEEANKRVFLVTLPGGHKFSLAAKDAKDAEKEIDKMAKP